MKRMTTNNNGSIWVTDLAFKRVNGLGYVDDCKLMERLAEYEDLGYSPKELKIIINDWKNI